MPCENHLWRPSVDGFLRCAVCPATRNASQLAAPLRTRVIREAKRAGADAHQLDNLRKFLFAGASTSLGL